MDTILIIWRNLKCQLTSLFQEGNLISSLSQPDLRFYKRILLTFHLCKFTLNHPFLHYSSHGYLIAIFLSSSLKLVPMRYFSLKIPPFTPETVLWRHLRKTSVLTWEKLRPASSQINQWPGLLNAGLTARAFWWSFVKTQTVSHTVSGPYLECTLFFKEEVGDC